MNQPRAHAGFECALATLERVAAPDVVRRSSLGAFAAALLDASADRDLPIVRGELRDSYGYTWTLQGTLATRAMEKRLNARSARLLEREAEPWTALAARHRGRSRVGLVHAAWRTLLTAHPHDTLCGCSIDAVAQAMELRVNAAAVQAVGLAEDAIMDLIGHDRTAARERRDAWTPIVIVRNAAGRERSGVAVLEIRQFIADVPVGPGSASASTSVPVARSGRPRVGGLGRLQSPRHYPDNDLVSVTEAVAWVTGVPGYGLVCLPFGGGRAPARAEDAVVVTSRELRNAHLSLDVDADGATTLVELSTGRRIDRLISLHDERDVGDLYTPAVRGIASTPEFAGVRRVHRGPLRGELALRWRLVAVAASGVRRIHGELTIRLALDAGAPFVRISVEGDNRAEDHRVRLAIATDVARPAVWADAAFGPVHRDPIVLDDAERKLEHAPPTAPLHRYVSLFDDARGATVYGDGLAEYESADDGRMLVTLVRAVGELSKNDLPERPGHAGWPSPTPRAQSIGSYDASFALMLHGPRAADSVDAIERTADDVLHPLAGTTLRSALVTPAPLRGVELDGVGLAVSAIKESEDGTWLVARCVNLTDERRHGTWRFGFPVAEARLARLDETPLAAIPVSANAVDIDVLPRGIWTVMVR